MVLEYGTLPWSLILTEREDAAMRSALIILVATAVSGVLALPETAEAQRRPQRQVVIPHCSRSIGAIALVEPENKWWEEYHLGSPESILRYYISESGCFTLVDRGRGMEAAERERALAAAGVLRPRSNIGGGQVRAADYVLTPDLLTSNNNSGGSGIAGIFGALIGGQAGAILGGVNLTSRTADVSLSLINVRSSESDIVVRGSARNTDLGWVAGGGTAGGSGFGGAMAGGYTNTEVGKVIMTAYLDAYIQLVDRLGGLNPEPLAAAPVSSVVTTSSVRLREGPSITTATVRNLSAGARLYPTGREESDWMEVEDEMHYRGWVSKLYLAPAN